MKGRKTADVWKKDVWEFQAKSGSSGFCCLLLYFIGKIAVQEMSGKTPGSPRHPSSRHPRPSERGNAMRGNSTESLREPPSGKSVSERTSENLREVPFCDLGFIASLPVGGFRRSSRRPSRRKIFLGGSRSCCPSSCCPFIFLHRNREETKGRFCKSSVSAFFSFSKWQVSES